MTKRVTAFIAVIAVIFTLCACGGVKKSGITGAEAQEEFWNSDLDASAEVLNQFRAQTPEEVTSIWRQAKMQGNGALIYALYAEDLKEVFLDTMKENGSWNMYYNSEPPTEVTLSEPIELEDEGLYISDITTLKADGKVYYSQIAIKLVDGGYYVVSEGAEYETQPDEYGENFLRDFGGEEFAETGT